MALGANRSNVVGIILRSAFLQVALGLMIGIPAAILSGHAMANQLFGVQSYDPAILLVTTAALSLAAFVAAVAPARRAASVEPMRALRAD
jgi:ABC-type antimicrobial peptide transport system permease subunit